MTTQLYFKLTAIAVALGAACAAAAQPATAADDSVLKVIDYRAGAATADPSTIRCSMESEIADRRSAEADLGQSVGSEFGAEYSMGLSPDQLPYLGPLEEQVVPYSVPAPPVGSDGSIMLDVAQPYQCVSYAQTYEWHLMPQGLIYRPYLAGAKESRFRSVWNNERHNGNIWDITLGGNVGLLRYGTQGDVRPEGWQLGIEGAGQVRLDIDEDRDVDAADFRFGVPLTWGDAISQVKFAYYHLSSHLGDEFLLKNNGYPRLNYSRDVLVLGHSIYPTENFRVYGEAGYGVYTDVSEPWEFQFGVDWAPNNATGGRGAPFAAFNGHLREEVDFGGNFVVQTGWAWRRSPATGLWRVGVEYYNGKDDQFSFFNESVEKVGLGLWYDY